MEKMDSETATGGDQINITIKTLQNSNGFSLTISSKITIGELKTKIAEKTGVASNAQRLIFKGKVLKDDTILASHGVQDGHALHMVERPPGAPATTEGDAQQQQQPSTQPGLNRYGPAVLLAGTLTMPEGSNPESLLPNILNAAGVAAPEGLGVPPQDPIAHLRQLFQQLHQNINNLPGTRTTPPFTNQRNNTETIGSFLAQLNWANAEIQPLINRSSTLLLQESELTDTDARNETQLISRQIGPIMQQIAAISGLLAPHLSSLNMGDGPGRATSEGRNRLSVSVPLFTVQRRADGTQAPAAPGAPVNLVQPNGQPLQPNQAVPVANEVMQPLFNMMRNLMGNMQRAPGAQPQQRGAAAPGMTPGTMPQATPQPNPSASNSTQAQANVAAFPPFVNQMFQSMFPAQNQNAQSAQQSTINPNPNAAVPAAQMMSQMFNVVNQALQSGGDRPVSAILGAVAGEQNAEENDDVFGDIFQLAMESLTVPDIILVMSGDWIPLQRLHPIISDHLRNNVLHGDVSPQRIQRLGDEIVAGLRESLDEQYLPQDIKDRIKPGKEVTGPCLSIIRTHSIKLFNIILSPLPPTAANPNPFAAALKEWTTHFAAELVQELTGLMKGGLPDVVVFIRYFLNERFEFLGPQFSEMGTNMITSYIMNTFSSQQGHTPTQIVPPPQRFRGITGDPRTWKERIQEDEQKQANSPPQAPFSDAYAAPNNNKKRKTRGTDATPQNVLADALKESTKTLKTEDNSGEREEKMVSEATQASSSLPQQFLQLISSDLKRRLASDPDFDETRFPASASMFTNGRGNDRTSSSSSSVQLNQKESKQEKKGS